MAAAAALRLQEEMGFSCELTPLGTLTYRAELDDGLIEHELAHIFRGSFAGAVHANPAECDGYAWVELADVHESIASAPQRYTAWFQKYVAAEWPVVRAPAA